MVYMHARNSESAFLNSVLLKINLTSFFLYPPKVKCHMFKNLSLMKSKNKLTTLLYSCVTIFFQSQWFIYRVMSQCHKGLN